MLVAGLQLARGLVDWNAVASDLERVARELDLCFSSLRAGGKIQWTGQAPEGVHPQDWLDALSNIRLACEYAAKQLATVGEIGPDFVRLGERAAEHSRHAKLFSAECPVQSVRWVEIGINNRRYVCSNPRWISRKFFRQQTRHKTMIRMIMTDG
jgi:ATP-dependent DNA helicase DinG